MAKILVMFLFLLSTEQPATHSLEHPEGHIEEEQQHHDDGGPDIHIVQLIPARTQTCGFKNSQ